MRDYAVGGGVIRTDKVLICRETSDEAYNQATVGPPSPRDG